MATSQEDAITTSPIIATTYSPPSPNPTSSVTTVVHRFDIEDAALSSGASIVSNTAGSPREAAGEDYPTGAQFYLTCLALALVLSLGALDGNIVATAVPSITDVSWTPRTPDERVVKY